MTTAISYIRFSSPKQLKGDSLRRQLGKMRAYVKKHNLTLDESLSVRDFGVTAWTGLNAERGLGLFLQAIEKRKVKEGSVLIVESLDRLSRQKVRTALGLFSQILDAGVNIATLEPERLYTDKNANDVAGLIEPLIIFARANEESETKSARLRSVWEKKRKQAAEEKMTARAPAWLRLAPDRRTWVVVKKKADLVRRLYQLALEGYGYGAIVHRINREKLPTLSGKSALWHAAIVKNLLRSRRVIGELHPHTATGHKQHRPVGDPIPDYYPAIIDTETFYRVQDILDSRKTQRGRIGNHVTNLFTELLRNAADKCRIRLLNRRRSPDLHTMISAGAIAGNESSTCISFPYETFQHAFLRWASELKSSDLQPARIGKDKTQEVLSKEIGRRGELKHRLSQLKARLKGHENIDTLIEAVNEMEAEKDAIDDRIERLQHQQHKEESAEVLKDVKSINEQLAEANGDELTQLRYRLRARIRQLVSEIWILIYRTSNERGKRRHRAIDVQVYFLEGGVRQFCVQSNGRSASVWYGYEEKPKALPVTWDLRKYDPKTYEPLYEWVKYGDEIGQEIIVESPAV